MKQPLYIAPGTEHGRSHTSGKTAYRLSTSFVGMRLRSMGSRAWFFWRRSRLGTVASLQQEHREGILSVSPEDDNDFAAGRTVADLNVWTGGCVMAVLMLNTIEPGLVPAMEPRAYLPMEISSVEDLWFSANEIIRSCMKYGLRFGWREEGEHRTTQLKILMAHPPRNNRPSLQYGRVPLGQRFRHRSPFRSGRNGNDRRS